MKMTIWILALALAVSVIINVRFWLYSGRYTPAPSTGLVLDTWTGKITQQLPQ